jgi:hypothetical protein
VNDVPFFSHKVSSGSHLEQILNDPVQRHINEIQKDAENKDGDDHHNGCIANFFEGRPCDFSSFCVDLNKESFNLGPEVLRFIDALLQFIRHNQFSCRLHNMTWQARRDSNPHHPVLETGALAVGATGLSSFFLLYFFMQSMMPAPGTVLLAFELIRSIFLILGSTVIPALAIAAL